MGVGMQIHPEEAMNWCQSKPAYEKIKRISDLLLSSILLAGMAVPMLMIAFAVRLDSPGPAFYLQFRLTQILTQMRKCPKTIRTHRIGHWPFFLLPAAGRRWSHGHRCPE